MLDTVDTGQIRIQKRGHFPECTASFNLQVLVVLAGAKEALCGMRGPGTRESSLRRR